MKKPLLGAFYVWRKKRDASSATFTPSLWGEINSALVVVMRRLVP
jgi:hypothetical protein